MLFVVAYISFFDNDLKQFIVSADDEFSAIYKTNVVEEGSLSHCDTIEEVKNFFFDMESAISVTKLEHSSGTNS